MRKKNTSLLSTPLTFQSLQAASFQLNKAPRRTVDAGSCTTDTKEAPGRRQSGSSVTVEGGVVNCGSNASEDNYTSGAMVLKKSGMSPASNAARDLGLLKPTRKRQDVLPSGSHIKRRPRSVARNVPIHNTVSTQFAKLSEKPSQETMTPLTQVSSSQNVGVGGTEKVANRSRDLVRPSHYERRADPSPAPSRPLRRTRRKANRQPFLTPPATVLSVGDGTPMAFVGNTLRALPSQASDTGSLTALPIPSPPAIGAGGGLAGAAAALAAHEEVGQHAGAGPDSPVTPSVQASWNLVGRAASSSNNTAAPSASVMYPRRRDSMYAKLTHMASESSAAASPHLPVFTTAASGACAQPGGRRGVVAEAGKRGALNASSTSSSTAGHPPSGRGGGVMAPKSPKPSKEMVLDTYVMLCSKLGEVPYEEWVSALSRSSLTLDAPEYVLHRIESESEDQMPPGGDEERSQSPLTLLVKTPGARGQHPLGPPDDINHTAYEPAPSASSSYASSNNNNSSSNNKSNDYYGGTTKAGEPTPTRPSHAASPPASALSIVAGNVQSKMVDKGSGSPASNASSAVNAAQPTYVAAVATTSSSPLSSTNTAAMASNMMRPTLFAANMRSRVAAGRCVDQVRAYCEQHLQPYVNRMEVLEKQRHDMMTCLTAFQRSCADDPSLPLSDEPAAGQARVAATTMERRAQRMSNALEALQQAAVRLLLGIEECAKAIGKPIGTIALEPEVGLATRPPITHHGCTSVSVLDGAETVLPHARHGTAQGSTSATTPALGGHPFPLNVLGSLAGAPPRGYVDFVRRQEKEVMTELRGVIDAVRTALQGPHGATPAPPYHFRVEDESIFDTPLFLPPALLLRSGTDAGYEDDEESSNINTTTSRRSSEENQQRPKAGRVTTGLTPRKSVYRTTTTPRSTTAMSNKTSTPGLGSAIKTPRTTVAPSTKTPRHTSGGGGNVLQRSSSQHAGAMRSLHTNHASSGSGAAASSSLGLVPAPGKTDSHGGKPPVAPPVTPSFVVLAEPATHNAELHPTSMPPTPTLLLRCVTFSRQTSGGSGNGTGHGRAAPALPPPRGTNIAGRTRSRSASIGAGRKPTRRSRSAALRSGVSPGGMGGGNLVTAVPKTTTDAVCSRHAVIVPTLTRAMLRDALAVWQTLVALAALTSKAPSSPSLTTAETRDTAVVAAASEDAGLLLQRRRQQEWHSSPPGTPTEGAPAATGAVVDALFVPDTHSPPDIAVTEERRYRFVNDEGRQDEESDAAAAAKLTAERDRAVTVADTAAMQVDQHTAGTTVGDGSVCTSLTPKLTTELMGAGDRGRTSDATALLSVITRTPEPGLSAPPMAPSASVEESKATTPRRTPKIITESTPVAAQRLDGVALGETEHLPPSAEVARAGAIIAGYMQTLRARQVARRERHAQLVYREHQVQAAQLNALRRRCVERFLRCVIYRLRQRHRRQTQPMTTTTREAAWAARTTVASPESPATEVAVMTTRERFQRARAQRQSLTAPSRKSGNGVEVVSAPDATVKRPAGAIGGATSLSPCIRLLDEVRRAPLPLIESGISTRDIANYNRDAESFEVAALHRLLRAPAALLYCMRMLLSRYPTCPPMAYAPHKDAPRNRTAASPDGTIAAEAVKDANGTSLMQPQSHAKMSTAQASPATRSSTKSDAVYRVPYHVFCWHLLYHASLDDIRDELNEARLSGSRDVAYGCIKSQRSASEGEASEGAFTAAVAEVRRVTERQSGGCGSSAGRQSSVTRSSALHGGLGGPVASYTALHCRLRQLSAPFTASYRSYADPDELRHRTPVVKDFARPFERWGCAHQLLRRVFTAAAIYAWKVIFSHTPHDDYKQRQLRTDKDRTERIERVCQRNHMILTCYGVRSEREWLREANSDLSFVGQLVSPRRALELDEREDEQQIKDTYEFVEDFLYQCFPTINALDDIPSFLIGAGVYFALKEVCHYSIDAPDALSFTEHFPGLVVPSVVSESVPGGEGYVEHDTPVTSSPRERRITWYQHTVLGRYELIRNLHHLCRVCDAAQHSNRHSTAVRTATAIGDAADNATLSALDALEKATRSVTVCDVAAKCGRGQNDGCGGVAVPVAGEAITSYLAVKGERQQQQLRPGVVLAYVPTCALLYGTHTSAQFLRQRDAAVCKALTLWASEAATRSSDVATDVVHDDITRNGELCVLFRKHFLVSLSTRLTMLLFGLRVDLEFCEGLDCIE